MTASTALLTDRYELTMLQAALADGTADRRCVFEVFTRRLPPGRRYGVVAGTGRVLDAVRDFRFDEEQLGWLAAERVVDERTLDYLRDYRFTGDVVGYAEGEVFFPLSPLMVVEGTFAEAVLLETVVLSILNYDSAIASAASRMTSAAVDRPCLEMGARRAQEEAAVAAARAAVIAGFAGTSNLEAGRRYGLPTIGTAAHAFTLLHDDEESAFAAQVASQGRGTTLLVDTYDVRRGVERALAAAGTELGAVRLDSGDLAALAQEVRAQLDAAGARRTKIVVTSDLDEYAIAALAVAPVDSYGVGTSVVTGSGAPTCGMVYKMVSRERADGSMEAVAKVSRSKASVGGRKAAARRLGPDGRAVEEVLVSGPPERVLAWQDAQWSSPEPTLRPLHVPLITGGVSDERWTGAAGVRLAQARHTASREELPRGARRLSADEAAVPTVTVRLEA
ncbi:MAG: nicotinate phosphoribosyltransferase [Cellulomonas sp. 73-145]|uniref:nicotinate phosphoribosyltransferase n=1 Tax=Cellulomonas sp. 73-145 TaxID=1895739 RepID=UPI00092A51B2|nr:nicotinate phosphoribosyltransferase [Cellulomonas sp. 73-145]MBN9326260.1 nicotinate phosphoribosyltransferase [Cellulomonas sp.]OJV57929.1 MAG: nicotinate phosphoribosyltransferase [Cellulomonas sp. 73-145]